MHRNSLSERDKTNRFENFFSFRGPRWLYRLCVIWAPFLFCHTFLYLLIHLRLAVALMLLTAELSWFCHQRSSKGGVQSLWWDYKGFGEPQMRGSKTAKSPHRQIWERHLKASLRRGTLADDLSVNVQYSTAGLFRAMRRFLRCHANTQLQHTHTHTHTRTHTGFSHNARARYISALDIFSSARNPL